MAHRLLVALFTIDLTTAAGGRATTQQESCPQPRRANPFTVDITVQTGGAAPQ
jgi:hypothetical protein